MNSLRFAAVVPAVLLLMSGDSFAENLRVPGDHKTIQAAINASAAGDTVLVAAGTYEERLRLKAGVTLRSEGDDAKGKVGLKRAEATILDGGGDAGTDPGVDMAAGSTLDGFTVTNIGTYSETKWKKHYATQGEEQSHEHIGAPGVAGIGIVGVSCTVRNNIVHHIGYSGIGISGVKGKRCSPLVTNNVCYRNMGGGIGSMKGSTAIIRSNICFENFFAGIGHDNSSPLVVNNICYGNIRAGIGISEGSKPIVRGNKCYKNRRAGIGTRTEPETQPLIENNECYENDMAGIGTREEAAPLIRNNKCYKNKLAGIGSRTGAHATIIGNECYENGKAGIGQRGDTRNTLIGNYCHHNKTSGIGFAACKEGHATVVNNRVIDNALVAVGINPGWTVSLSGNELSRKGGLPPIVMVFNGASATFTGNVIRGGGVAGIRVAGDVKIDDNRFEGTSLRRRGPPNFAVWALKGSTVAMSDNEITTWRHALSAGEANVTAINNTVGNFHSAAFVVNKSPSPPQIIGNTAYSNDAKAKVVSMDRADGINIDNEIKPMRTGKSSSAIEK
ncbi:MAG: right-handed parallel beta-helix repeat-containing protein [Planctomycetaceae bacterium]|nr:right-handed parallel beta-helix repeat-containing protein [Planctomycetaceae bacterium]MBT6484370.1 right-handed parallel beta-helix repeat-containing protein [Planctomycetaceae bacterium]